MAFTTMHLIIAQTCMKKINKKLKKHSENTSLQKGMTAKLM